jgi:uncharacterized protein (UPF0332 family)
MVPTWDTDRLSLYNALLSMTRRAKSDQVLIISKSGKDYLENLKRGVYLESATGYTIEELKLIACRDRYLLAIAFLKEARRAANGRPARLRNAISRAYYAMYHAIRALVFLHEAGDDFQEHSELPHHLPGNFPNRQLWENKLKNARLERNKADYDPYPREERSTAKTASVLLRNAEELLPIVRTMLKAKGCKI